MSGISVKINAEAIKKIRELHKKFGNLTPFFKNFGEVWLPNTKERFYAETDPNGDKWKPLAESTIRRKKGRSYKILQGLGDRGGLVGTLAYYADQNSISIGSNKVYARIHQLGGETGRNKSTTIPARPYLGLSDRDEKDLLDLLSDFLMN